MNKANYLALGAVALTLISIFTPWLQLSVPGNISDASAGYEPKTIYGISIGYGIFGMLVALLSGYLILKESKWTFVPGIVNFINGYGYLHEWFGKGTHDSGNYGDVTSKSIVDPKFGIYLFILGSIATIIFTLKYYKLKKEETILAPYQPVNEHQQPAFTIKNTSASQVYQPTKIQKMTTSSTEMPTEPTSSETPNVPETPVEKANEQLPVTPSVPEKVEPTVTSQPTEAPKEPEQAVVNEPASVYQAPISTATPQPPYIEPEKKKSSTPWIILIIVVVVLACSALFVMTNTSSQKSKDKTEQSISDEKSRLEIIINEVNQDVNDKKYDDALLKINSINWLFDPTTNKGYVDQYNSQRENLRNTIEQLKTNKELDDQKQAADKANESAAKSVQTTDSIK